MDLLTSFPNGPHDPFGLATVLTEHSGEAHPRFLPSRFRAGLKLHLDGGVDERSHGLALARSRCLGLAQQRIRNFGCCLHRRDVDPCLGLNQASAAG